jgi:hypothetical protein
MGVDNQDIEIGFEKVRFLDEFPFQAVAYYLGL